MTRRRKIVFVVALVAVIGIAWLIVHRPREPSYQGKSLSTWVAALAKRRTNADTGLSWRHSTECEDAIRHIGTNAVPYLLDMLQAKDSRIKSKLADFLNNQRVIRVHITIAAEQRWLAMHAFGVLGADAKSAVPEMAKMFANAKPPDRFDIGESLWRILPGKAIEFSGYAPDRIYQLPRDELLKTLGTPTILHVDWAAYDMGNSYSGSGYMPSYLCIGFVHGRVLDSTVFFTTNTNFVPPFELK